MKSRTGVEVMLFAIDGVEIFLEGARKTDVQPEDFLGKTEGLLFKEYVIFTVLFEPPSRRRRPDLGKRRVRQQTEPGDNPQSKRRNSKLTSAEVVDSDDSEPSGGEDTNTKNPASTLDRQTSEAASVASGSSRNGAAHLEPSRSDLALSSMPEDTPSSVAGWRYAPFR